MGKRWARVEKRTGRKTPGLGIPRFTAHARTRWTERGDPEESIRHAWLAARFVGQWGVWLAFRHKKWIFLVILRPCREAICVSVWPEKARRHLQRKGDRWVLKYERRRWHYERVITPGGHRAGVSPQPSGMAQRGRSPVPRLPRPAAAEKEEEPCHRPPSPTRMRDTPRQ